MADTGDLKSPAARRAGSNPAFSTREKARKFSVSGLFLCHKNAFYPYFYPYQLQLPLFQALNERLHTGGAGLFHRFRDMTVLVKSEGGCMVAEVLLYRFNIITSPER